MAEHTLFPSVLPDRDEPFVDNQYSTEELERKDRRELQKIASDHPNKDVNGKSTNEDIIETLAGEERV